jgi:hypothetical protein
VQRARVGTQVDFYRLSRAALGESSERPLAPPLVPRPAQQRPEQRVPPLRFDDLVHLDGKSLAGIVDVVDAKILILALAGASHELAERMLRTLPRRTSRKLKKLLCQLGPTRLGDVEAAQQLIAGVAAKHLLAVSRTAG